MTGLLPLPCVGAMVVVGAGGLVTAVGGVKSIVVDFVGQVMFSTVACSIGASSLVFDGSLTLD